jgi:hypothetical protein
MNFEDSSPQKWMAAIASLLVIPPWIWMAVRTKNCLQFVTAGRIPFPKRTIWLMKVLALVVAAGGASAASADLGMPWILALLPGSIIIFFTLRENVEEIIPSKPAQDPAAYHSSWKRYWMLRSAYTQSLRWVGAAFLFTILILIFATKLPKTVGGILLCLCFVTVVVLVTTSSVRKMKLFRWPCPRCGCSFNGLWNRPWFPKNCVYCGLPREDEPNATFQNFPVSGGR